MGRKDFLNLKRIRFETQGVSHEEQDLSQHPASADLLAAFGRRLAHHLQ
jgi:hypothetical protein